MSETLIGVQRGFDYYLPIAEIARAVKFPSQLDIERGTIVGTFFNSQNTYEIDVKSNGYVVRDERTQMPDGSFFINDLGDGFGDIYATVETINKIWPLRLEVDFSEQVVRITTPKLLAYELELKRKKLQALFDREEEEESGPKLEYVNNTYKLLNPHTFNLSSNTSWSEKNSDITKNLGISGRGHLLGTTANYTANIFSDENKAIDLTTMRLKMTREDFGDGAALPFGLKIAQIGDISARPPVFIDRNFSGRGLYVATSRKPNNRSFDEITVEGTAQPGWEAEIYRGRELLDFGVVDETGAYRFDNIPINYGNTEIRVIIYGPQGQSEEIKHNYQISRKMLKPGEITYEASILEDGRPLFDLQGNFTDQSVENTKFLRVNRGINHWLTGFFTATQTPTKTDTKEYITLGGRFNALDGTGQIEFYKDLDEGSAIDTRFSTNFSGVNTVLRTSIFNDFESDQVGVGDNARTFEGEFRANKAFDFSFAQLDLNLRGLYTKLKGGKKTSSASFSQTFSKDRINLSHSLSSDYTKNKGQESENTTNGTFSLGIHNLKRWDIRTALDYNLRPDIGLNTSRLNLNYDNLDKFKASLDLNQGIKNTDEARARLGASYDFGTFLGGAAVDWDKQDGLGFRLTTSTTLGPDGDDNRYIASTEYSQQNTTALKIHLYYDVDRDGEFGENDEPVKGARIFINNRKSKVSDEHGYIDIMGAGAPGLVNITLDQESVPNPYMDAALPGYRTVLRPGTKPFIDIALIETGVIDGIVRNSDDRPLPGMIIQLIDQYGQLAAETTTVFDGFYTFELVKPGRYVVQVHPSHRVFVPTRTVTVAPEDLFAYGVDLQILKQAIGAPVVIETDGESGGVAHTYHAPATGGTELLVSKPSGGGVQPVVRAVRIGEHPHKVRLVLDLSEPTRYRITKDPNGSVITIDLPDVRWDAKHPSRPDKHSIFSSCDIQDLPGGGTQIRLEGRDKIDVFYNALLPSEEGRSDRIYIDFMRSTK